jgi:hypothetical protein
MPPLLHAAAPTAATSFGRLSYYSWTNPTLVQMSLVGQIVDRPPTVLQKRKWSYKLYYRAAAPVTVAGTASARASCRLPGRARFVSVFIQLMDHVYKEGKNSSRSSSMFYTRHSCTQSASIIWVVWWRAPTFLRPRQTAIIEYNSLGICLLSSSLLHHYQTGRRFSMFVVGLFMWLSTLSPH